MFFHIDESGNTGNNLFDANQPRLSYGVLSSRTNVDALGVPLYRAMLSKLGVTSLHASQLGAGRLEAIGPHLLALQQKMNFEFGFYVIEKRTYAVVRLFEAVFDAGLNDAVPWAHYWTPLRFYLIHHLSQLVDEPLLRSAWDLSTELSIERRLNDVVELLGTSEQPIHFVVASSYLKRDSKRLPSSSRFSRDRVRLPWSYPNCGRNCPVFGNKRFRAAYRFASANRVTI